MLLLFAESCDGYLFLLRFLSAQHEMSHILTDVLHRCLIRRLVGYGLGGQ